MLSTTKLRRRILGRHHYSLCLWSVGAKRLRKQLYYYGIKESDSWLPVWVDRKRAHSTIGLLKRRFLAEVSKGLLVSQCPFDTCNIPVSAIHDPGHGRGVIICFVMIMYHVGSCMLGICFIMIVMTMVMPTPNSHSCTIWQQNPSYSFNNCDKMLAEARYTNPPAVKSILWPDCPIPHPSTAQRPKTVPIKAAIAVTKCDCLMSTAKNM